MEANIGDIVQIKYSDFDGKETEGMFLIYGKDPAPLTSFYAVKVCTRSISFEVPILKSDFDFLDHDSFINCICQQKFRVDQIKHRWGMVNTTVLAKVRKQLQNISIKIDDQLESEIKRQNIIAKINTKSNVF